MAKENSGNSRLFRFAYEIAYRSRISDVIQIITWIIEKLMVLAPAIFYIYKNTDWEIICSLFQYLRCMNLILVEASLIPIVAIIFGVFQIVLGLTVFALLTFGKEEIKAAARSYSKIPLINTVLGHSYLIILRILLQPITTIFAYLIVRTNWNPDYSKFKLDSSAHIIDSLSWQHIVALIFIGTCFIECLIVALFRIFFLNDLSVMKTTVWSSNSCKTLLIELLTKVYISMAYISDTDDSSIGITCFAACILYGILLALRFLKTRCAYFWADSAELFYESFAFFLQLFILGGNVVIDTDSNYMSVPALLIFSFQLCLLKGYSFRKVNLQRIKTEDEAMVLLESIAHLCTSKEPSSGVLLSSLLCKHIKKCFSEGCECRELLSKSHESKTDFVILNYSTYSILDSVPRQIRKSWKINALRIILNDLLKRYGKSDELTLLIAQLSFLFCANHFTAIGLISNLEMRKPPLLVKMQAYYLRAIINQAMLKQAVDSPDLMDSLEYQSYYQQFLGEAEDIAELTLKFWSTLMCEIPDNAILNSIGILFYNARKRLMETISQINRINANNVDFFVKYGLCMKLILHDETAASYAFNNIFRSSEKIYQQKNSENAFSLLKSNTKNIMIVISLEAKNFMSIVDINDEAEDLLQYPRKELVGNSIIHIMPPMIARSHHLFIQKYFQTMETTSIGIKKGRFIKTKEGLYRHFRTIKNIVPSLNNGLQAVMLAHEDRKILRYSITKKEKTSKHAGAIICANDLKVIGFTREAAELLNIPERVLIEGTNRTHLDALVPELVNTSAIDDLSLSSGGIVNLSQKSFLFEGDEELQISDEKSIEMLVWARIIKESYGGTENATIFIFSPIQITSISNYIKKEENGLYLNKQKIDIEDQDNQQVKRRKKGATHQGGTEQPGEPSNLIDNAFEMSVSDSEGSAGGSSVNTGSSHKSLLAKDLVDRTFSEETPSSISKLAGIMMGFIIIIISLIGIIPAVKCIVIESTLCYTEAKTLQERFVMIEEFEVRYKNSLIIYNNAKAYYTTRIGGAETAFQIAEYRVGGSLDFMKQYHVNTCKNFAKLGLDYGTRKLTITERGEQLTVGFNHAMIKLINHCANLVKITSYLTFVSLYKNPTSTACVENQNAIDYVELNTFMPMRIAQETASNLLRTELETLAADGERNLYILICSCVGIVLASIVIISPVFFWVIRDKSYVIAIFADILDHEIQSVISLAATFNVKQIKYKRRWISSSRGEEDVFWQKILRAKSRDKQRINAISAIPIAEIKKGKNSTIKPSESPLKVKSESEIANEVKKEDLIDTLKQEGNQELLLALSQNPKELQINEEQKKKCEKKKSLLSRLDSKLRNNAIIRLSIVLFVFLIYGGISLYFNYFFHDFNRTTTKHFYNLHKRNLYIPTVGSLLRKTVATGNKMYVQRNPDPNGIYYEPEVLEQQLLMETAMKNFEKTGSRDIFPRYFDSARRFDSPEFCALVDALPAKQANPCPIGYKGPKDQGLSAGMAYLIEYHDTYGIKALNTNFSDPAQVYALQNDPVFLIFLQTVNQYLIPAIERNMIIFREEALTFFDLIKKLSVIKASVFSVIFMVVYLIIFILFLGILKREIWQTHNVMNMIPDSILEKNKAVQEQVCKRKGLK